MTHLDMAPTFLVFNAVGHENHLKFHAHHILAEM